MSSQNVRKSRKLETASFLHVTNPEIFHTKPRPGGLVPIVNVDLKPNVKKTEKVEKKNKSKDGIPVEEKISRDFRVHKALDEVASIDSQELTLPNPIKDAMFMFGVTISGVIMLAANYRNMPEDYIDWIKNGLDGVRDEFGHHPPNVQGILNHLGSAGRTGGTGKSEPSGGGEDNRDNDEVADGNDRDNGEAAEGSNRDNGEDGEGNGGDDGIADLGEDEDKTVRSTTRVRLSTQED